MYHTVLVPLLDAGKVLQYVTDEYLHSIPFQKKTKVPVTNECHWSKSQTKKKKKRVEKVSECDMRLGEGQQHNRTAQQQRFRYCCSLTVGRESFLSTATKDLNHILDSICDLFFELQRTLPFWINEKYWVQELVKRWIVCH